MVDDASFADFVDFVLRVDELLYDGRDDNQPVDVPRRRCRDRLNPLEHFNDREFLMRYRFRKTTVVSLLESLPLEAGDRGLPLSPMLQLLIALRFYGAGTFQLATGDLRRYLAVIGGDDAKEKAFTWYETKDKRRFCDLHFCQMMCVLPQAFQEATHLIRVQEGTPNRDLHCIFDLWVS
ncbi:hypothetical protein HPB47_028313 [Ixodes persulcatus]|uniref:Uncharacterized protein n=1 Tax=Ixodes persulcatus TaxID=34615 RepID=A0AC60PTJ2_IXOPE|nr:hypothetical protein HPB47_028313 [Ixodes persulcatus]